MVLWESPCSTEMRSNLSLRPFAELAAVSEILGPGPVVEGTVGGSVAASGKEGALKLEQAVVKSTTVTNRARVGVGFGFGLQATSRNMLAFQYVYSPFRTATKGVPNGVGAESRGSSETHEMGRTRRPAHSCSKAALLGNRCGPK